LSTFASILLLRMSAIIKPHCGVVGGVCLQRNNKAPNVWQQLLTRCNRSPACLRARQKELEQELAAAHKGELAHLLLLLLLFAATGPRLAAVASSVCLQCMRWLRCILNTAL
jgi:hypothetical protein